MEILFYSSGILLNIFLLLIYKNFYSKGEVVHSHQGKRIFVDYRSVKNRRVRMNKFFFVANALLSWFSTGINIALIASKIIAKRTSDKKVEVNVIAENLGEIEKLSDEFEQLYNLYKRKEAVLNEDKMIKQKTRNDRSEIVV